MKLYLKINKLFNEDIKINNHEAFINNRFFEIEKQNGTRIAVSPDKRRHLWADCDLDHKGYLQKPRSLK